MVPAYARMHAGTPCATITACVPFAMVPPLKNSQTQPATPGKATGRISLALLTRMNPLWAPRHRHMGHARAEGRPGIGREGALVRSVLRSAVAARSFGGGPRRTSVHSNDLSDSPYRRP